MTGSAIPQREAGVLLHPTSLPGPDDHGDLGPDAFRFIDFLAKAGIGVWQMLPLGPTHFDGSPYSCLSVHAGDPGLISLQPLVDAGWLDAGAVSINRHAALHDARIGFAARASNEQRHALEQFCDEQSHWLQHFALFIAIRNAHDSQDWSQWPTALRDRNHKALRQASQQHADTVAQVRFEQFLFHQQWRALRDYASANKVRLFGDLPIFVAYDSADVWSNRDQFLLDPAGRPSVVAGVPPDYFSATGQRWGNPLYDWQAMAADDYYWWRNRLRSQLALFDLVRIDHFRGFEAYWEIPADCDTAIDGSWKTGPGDGLFAAIAKDLGAPLPLVAEDLGVITPAVEALRDNWKLPGMKILQFAFDGSPDNPYLPHNHLHNCVVYTGTHDNDTTLGWHHGLDQQARERVSDYLGHPSELWPWPLIRSAWASVACLSVVPMQDLLGLGGGHRMNVPGVAGGNWRWRFQWKWIPDDLAPRLEQMGRLYDRLGGDCPS